MSAFHDFLIFQHLFSSKISLISFFTLTIIPKLIKAKINILDKKNSTFFIVYGVTVQISFQQKMLQIQ